MIDLGIWYDRDWIYDWCGGVCVGGYCSEGVSWIGVYIIFFDCGYCCNICCFLLCGVFKLVFFCW